MTGKAPLEGEGSRVTDRLQPDFLAPADKPFFVTPRWHARVYVGDVLVLDCGLSWISAVDETTAIAYLRGMGFTDAVRYEVEEVRA